jgi:hypothetical protein
VGVQAARRYSGYVIYAVLLYWNLGRLFFPVSLPLRLLASSSLDPRKARYLRDTYGRVDLLEKDGGKVASVEKQRDPSCVPTKAEDCNVSVASVFHPSEAILVGLPRFFLRPPLWIRPGSVSFPSESAFLLALLSLPLFLLLSLGDVVVDLKSICQIFLP